MSQSWPEDEIRKQNSRQSWSSSPAPPQQQAGQVVHFPASPQPTGPSQGFLNINLQLSGNMGPHMPPYQLHPHQYPHAPQYLYNSGSLSSLPVLSEVTPDRISSIAKTVVKYAKENLDLEQIKQQLWRTLPLVPKERWKAFCERSYDMDIDRMRAAQTTKAASNLTPQSEAKAIKDHHEVFQPVKTETSSTKSAQELATSLRDGTAVENSGIDSERAEQPKRKRIEHYFAPRVAISSEVDPKFRVERSSTDSPAPITIVPESKSGKYTTELLAFARAVGKAQVVPTPRPRPNKHFKTDDVQQTRATHGLGTVSSSDPQPPTTAVQAHQKASGAPMIQPRRSQEQRASYSIHRQKSKRKCVLARSVLLAAGKLPNETLNSGFDRYKHYVARDILQTQFDVIDPPQTGIRPLANRRGYHPYIATAMQELRMPTVDGPSADIASNTASVIPALLARVSNQTAADIRIKPSSTRDYTSPLMGSVLVNVTSSMPASVPNGAPSMPASVTDIAREGFQRPTTSITQRTHARNVVDLTMEDITDPIQEVDDVPAFRKPAKVVREKRVVSSESNEDALAAASLYEKGATELITATKPLKVSSDFTLVVVGQPAPSDYYYNPNEGTEINAIDERRDRELQKLDPDHAGYDSGESDTEIASDAVGFPVFRCGFYNCGAELHDYDTMVLHCDRVHGHPDISGNFLCLWGDCRPRQIFFNDMPRWQAHLDEEHQQSIRHVCLVKDCKQAFPYEDDLMLHMSTVHADLSSRSGKRKRGGRGKQSHAQPLSSQKRQFTNLDMFSQENVIAISDDDSLNSGDDIDLLGFNESVTKRPVRNAAIRHSPPPPTSETMIEANNSSSPAHDTFKKLDLDAHVGWSETFDVVDGIILTTPGKSDRTTRKLVEEVVRPPMPVIEKASPIKQRVPVEEAVPTSGQTSWYHIV